MENGVLNQWEAHSYRYDMDRNDFPGRPDIWNRGYHLHLKSCLECQVEFSSYPSSVMIYCSINCRLGRKQNLKKNNQDLFRRQFRALHTKTADPDPTIFCLQGEDGTWRQSGAAITQMTQRGSQF